jgi:rhamnogalacturonyl hydrolase YesR
MAWGVRARVLASETYLPVIAKAWTAMASSVHPNGFLGYVQGTGKQPSDGQPVTFNSVPNYEDFGLGCFLLGGSEVARLASP